MSDDHQQEARSEWIPTIGQSCSFPRKVQALLQYAQINDLESVTCWTADGKGFHVFSPTAFMEEIAPRFFPNHASFRSFERMLNIWGFKRERVPPPQKMFWNSNFQRDKPELCRNMSRNENKGTKQLVSVSGMQRYIHMKNNIPSWAKDHQQAALQYFSAQSTPKNLPDSQDEEQRQLKLCGQTEEEDRHERNSILHQPYVAPKANREELGRLESVRLKQPSSKSAYQQRNELAAAIVPPHDQLSSNVNTCCSSQVLRIEIENHVTSKSNEMLSEESAVEKCRSLVDENDGFGSLLYSDSAWSKNVFPEGQFDDAPDPLLVLANVAVSDSVKDDPGNRPRREKGTRI